MKTLIDLYNEDITAYNAFMDSLNMQVSVLMSGISLQVYFNEETNKYEYHTHSDELAIGPKISRLTKYFCKDITDAIEYIKSKIEVVANYRFLNFTIYDKTLYLISFMSSLSTDIVDDYESLNMVASALGVKSIPVIFKGRLTKQMQDTIASYITFNTNVAPAEFKDKFKTLFSPYNGMDYTTIMNTAVFDNIDYLEGLVFSINFGTKCAKYKIVDQQYAQLKKEEKARKELYKTVHKEDRSRLMRCLVDWLENKATQKDESHMKSLELNFIEMCENKKILMKLLNVAGKLPLRSDPVFMLQVDLLDSNIQALIRKHGTPMRTMYEQYLLTFYKHRDNLDYDKELIKKIDKIIDNI